MRSAGEALGVGCNGVGRRPWVDVLGAPFRRVVYFPRCARSPPVAQLVKQGTHNSGVAGSNPARADSPKSSCPEMIRFGGPDTTNVFETLKTALSLRLNRGWSTAPSGRCPPS